MKKYLMSQYGLYIEKISDKKQWLTVTLIDDLRKDKEKYLKISNEIMVTCEKLYKNPRNIIVS